MAELDVTGERTEEEPKPKPKNHASVKDRPRDASRIYTRPDRAERAWEKDIRERAERTQARLVEWLTGREDYEMAEVIQEDGIAMIGGLIALAGSLEWIRKPIIGALAFAEPFIAFGRLARVLLGRLRDARLRAAEERAQADYEAQVEAERLAQEEAAQEQQRFRHNVVE